MAHLDTRKVPKIRRITDRFIDGQGFDDRLGCAWAYKLSEELGADLLLTDHEESGGTTGQFHKLKNYNWIVEFDREGVDVVTYDLDNPIFLKALKDYWKIGNGSYTDLCELKTDACCFNLGLGHYNSHGRKAYINIKEMRDQINKFRHFFAEHKDIKYTQIKHQANYLFSESNVCEFCNAAYGTEIFDTIICYSCFQDIIASHYNFDMTNERDALDMLDYDYKNLCRRSR